MHVDVIEGFDALKGVRGDWEAVYAADPEVSLFMSWRWMADWLAARPTVWLVLAAKESPTDDRYVAFLPLRMRVHFDKERGFVNEPPAAAMPTTRACWPGPTSRRRRFQPSPTICARS
ncbi:hypothetical protein [Brevundimonas sp. NPDC046655]|uniref:hypothetical protein n=1 Tax=unclassified Brevundimonas TaxID=2622653 RepID=UPI00384BAFFF